MYSRRICHTEPYGSAVSKAPGTQSLKKKKETCVQLTAGALMTALISSDKSKDIKFSKKVVCVLEIIDCIL